MSEEPRQKRSTILAVENVKRIADQLRSERNDALALAQVQRERGDSFASLLAEARGQMKLLADKAPADTGSQASALIERIDQTLAKYRP